MWAGADVDRVVGRHAPINGEGFRRHSPARVITKQGEMDMGDKGSKDKGKKEHQKKAAHTLKEKRKIKKGKKENKGQ